MATETERWLPEGKRGRGATRTVMEGDRRRGSARNGPHGSRDKDVDLQLVCCYNITPTQLIKLKKDFLSFSSFLCVSSTRGQDTLSP